MELQRFAQGRRFSEERPVKFGTVFQNLTSQVFLVFQFLQIGVYNLASVNAVVGFCPDRWKMRMELAFVERFFELFGAPTGSPIKLQPFVDLPAVRFQVVRKDTRMGDRVTGAVEGVVGVFAFGVNNFVVDHRCWTNRVTAIDARYLPHVAILAGNALTPCRRSAILIPDDLQFDPWLHGDLMARNAERRFA